MDTQTNLLLESFMPYLSPNYQQTLGTLLQLCELEKNMAEYAQKNLDWRHEMLMSMRPQLPPRKQQMIDVLVRVIEINNIMAEMDGMR